MDAASDLSVTIPATTRLKPSTLHLAGPRWQGAITDDGQGGLVDAGGQLVGRVDYTTGVCTPLNVTPTGF